jgi:hypothetical protein
MRLPEFLIIGAMKAGTTTLCSDLQQSPGIFLPSVKEPHELCRPDVLDPAGRDRYAGFFRGARPGQRCGEGSTGYTKLPWNPEVPDRALELLGPGLRLIYIVRDPVARLESHYRHLVRAGTIDHDIDEAVRRVPQLVHVSRYGMQLAPWIERFGRDQVHVVCFEEYVTDRRGTIDSLCRFLAVPPPAAGTGLRTVLNAGDSLRFPSRATRTVLSPIRRSGLYRRAIHPRLPAPVRAGMRRLLLRKSASPPAAALAPETVAALWREFEEDRRRLTALLGHEPPWRAPGGEERDGIHHPE